MVQKIPELKYKFLGVYPADMIPNLTNNSFIIINTAKASDIGEHWVMLANRNEKIFFGDSMGQSLEAYQHIRIPYSLVYRLIHKRLQDQPLCGLYAIFFAWSVFSGTSIETFLTTFI